MPTLESIDETVSVTRDDQWQYIRIPLSVTLPANELHLHRDSADGPITLSPSSSLDLGEQKARRLETILADFDAAFAAGETLEIERPFCPPREVEI